MIRLLPRLFVVFFLPTLPHCTGLETKPALPNLSSVRHRIPDVLYGIRYADGFVLDWTGIFPPSAVSANVDVPLQLLL
jgi:hypothetical protein